MRPRVLVLGGVDPCGGAGITADARALELHGCHALAVATCSTVQNRFGFVAVEPLPQAHVDAALRAALDDGPLHAVKFGLFAGAAALAHAIEVLAGRALPTVIDPVLSATAGGYQAGDAILPAYAAAMHALRPILTPNLLELARLAPDGGAGELLAAGCSAVVVKDGHGSGPEAVDRVFLPDGVFALPHARAACGPVHGTGCAFASAIAAGIARGQDVTAAASAAGRWVAGCLAAMGPSHDRHPRPLAMRALR